MSGAMQRANVANDGCTRSVGATRYTSGGSSLICISPNNFARAKLFGELQIKDEPPLVYLVAPTLRVHPSFATFARCIAPDIEIYRFDVNEDWRSGVHVMRRIRVN